MHADDYQLETQISGIACVNDTNLNHDLGDSLELESSSTDRFPGNNLKQKSENLANIVQKIININMQPADEAELLRKSLETSVSQTVMDYRCYEKQSSITMRVNCCLTFWNTEKD